MLYMVTMDVYGESVEEAISDIIFPKGFVGTIYAPHIEEIGEKQYRVIICLEAESEEYIRKHLLHKMSIIRIKEEES